MNYTRISPRNSSVFKTQLAARLVFNLRKYDRITPALVTLHWLPVKYRIEFKTLLIVFKGLHDKAPNFIQEMITQSKSKRYSIRSNEERVLKVPKFKHDTFGKRAFAVYGPLAWNCLPKEIRLCDEIEAFKRNLKTHLFVKFVNESTIWFRRIIVKRPRMKSAQFVALYKPCKPKPKPKPEWNIESSCDTTYTRLHRTLRHADRVISCFQQAPHDTRRHKQITRHSCHSYDANGAVIGIKAYCSRNKMAK